jgi:hypothetical protein
MEDNMEVVPSEPVASSGNTFTQAQLEDIVKREKARAAESARQKMEAQHREEIERLRAGTEPERGRPGNEVPLDASAIKQQVYDQFMDDLQKHHLEAQREAEEREAKKIAEQYHLKMAKGSQLFDDFNEVIGDFKPGEFHNTVFLAAQMDNTNEIMYELAKNPSKLIEIDSLAEKSPSLAMKQLQKLSDSIKANLNAKLNNVSAEPPLSRLKSSSTVGADSGKMTLKDLKNQDWLRG